MYCKPCNKRFKTNEDLQQHLENAAVHLRNIPCPRCEKKFGKTESLGQHLRDSNCGTAERENSGRNSVSSTKKSFSIYPDLSAHVAQCMASCGLTFRFHDTDDPTGSSKCYNTCIVGAFRCRNKSCSADRWFSQKISTSIRMYPGYRYNARVYHQRCKQCNQVSRPELDVGVYVDRISYRLKKWNGISVQKPPFSGKGKGPHLSGFCEGCRLGICELGDQWSWVDM